MFSILINTPSDLLWDPLTYSIFENKPILLIFQLRQSGDFECTEIFEITEYLHYLEINTSWQYCSPGLNLLFCSRPMGDLDHHR